MTKKMSGVSERKQRFSIRKHKKAVSAVLVGTFLIFGISFDSDASEKKAVGTVETEESGKQSEEAKDKKEAEQERLEVEAELLAEIENAQLMIQELEYLAEEDQAYYLEEVELSEDVETVQALLEEATVANDTNYQAYLEEVEAEEERLKAEEAKRLEEEKKAQEEQAKKEAEEKARVEREKEAEREAEKEQEEQEKAEEQEEAAEEVDESEETETTEEDEVVDESEETEEDSDQEEVEEEPEVEEEKEVVEEAPEQQEVPETSDEVVTEPVQPEENVPAEPYEEEYIAPEQPVEQEVPVEEEPEQAPTNFQKGVDDAYKNAKDQAQLEEHLTNIVNTTFKVRDSEEFMKSLEVNLEDLSPQEFTYMLLKKLSENIDAKSVVVTRDDTSDVLIAEGVKNLSPDLSQAKADSKNNLSLMFYLDDEARASYQHQIEEASDHGQLTAIMMVANTYNNMNMPDYVAFGNHASENTESIVNGETEVSETIRSLSFNNDAVSGIKDLNYIPFELTSENTGVESTSYKLQIQLDERIAQHVMAMTVHPHESYITKPFKRVTNEAGQLTNVWQIDYNRLFTSEEDIKMTAKNGLIMLEDSISNIVGNYDDLRIAPLTYQTAVVNDETGKLVASTITKNTL